MQSVQPHSLYLLSPAPRGSAAFPMLHLRKLRHWPCTHAGIPVLSKSPSPAPRDGPSDKPEPVSSAARDPRPTCLLLGGDFQTSEEHSDEKGGLGNWLCPPGPEEATGVSVIKLTLSGGRCRGVGIHATQRVLSGTLTFPPAPETGSPCGRNSGHSFDLLVNHCQQHTNAFGGASS